MLQQLFMFNKLTYIFPRHQVWKPCGLKSKAVTVMSGAVQGAEFTSRHSTAVNDNVASLQRNMIF